MNPENFIVRMHLETVERFQQRDVWDKLSEADGEILQREVAGLPSQTETDEVESRMFDLTALRMQLALAEGDLEQYEHHRLRVVEIAMLLEEKSTVPAVRAQLGYLAAMQESGFWEGMDINGLEEMRLRLRDLMPLLDKKKRNIVYTDFKDEVMNVRDEEAIYMPKMTGTQYAKKVKDYLQSHVNDFVIHRLRTNQPLTELDLQGLESTLMQIGEEDGEQLLSGLLAKSESPSLAYFVRSLVGLDRTAVQSAFSAFLSDRSLTPPQIRFVGLVIDQLTTRGVMDASALYEPPFSHIHTGGPEELFAGNKKVIDGIFEQLKAVNASVVDMTG
jgi:type I restriction enzyme R subunit